jgi:CRP-like cAMP-binding protein
MKEVLRYLCNTYSKLTDDAMGFILHNTDEQVLQRGEILMKAGQICDAVWFVKKGLLRAYQEDPEDPTKIFSNWFMTENDTATSVVSFFLGLPSVETIVAEEPTVVYRMSKKDLFAGTARFHSLSQLTMIIIINYYVQTRITETFLRMKRPEYIHQHMLAECPELLLRLHEDVKASYLGISTTKYRQIKGGKGNSKKAESKKKNRK